MFGDYLVYTIPVQFYLSYYHTSSKKTETNSIIMNCGLLCGLLANYNRCCCVDPKLKQDPKSRNQVPEIY